ncbi:phage Gp37/Gp68 family protein [Dongia sp.]|uniref:phage Gp37/Gp68 family protein n=1 Tax=Dongia sp. TaxID=1977262 RepID=UPI0035B1DB55
MTDATDIEWTDRTWNVIRGCSRVSEGCRNCYAQGIAARFNGPGQPYEGLATRRRGSDGKVIANWTGQTLFVDPLLLKPFKWKTPQFIFVNSMSDLFHETVTDDHLDQVFAVMALCPQHTFQILTKRPERMRDYCRSLGRHHSEDRISLQIKRMVDADMVSPGSGFFYSAGAGIGWHIDNLWLGVSVEDQATADARVPILLDTPAALRWVSYEPALGPVNFTDITRPASDFDRMMPGFASVDRFSLNALDGFHRIEYPGSHGKVAVARTGQASTPKLDWIVCGGESGPNARPSHPDWFRSLRDQCLAAGVPFLFKQWGEWAPGDTFGAIQDGPVTDRHGNVKDWMRRYVVCADHASRLDAHSFTEHATNLVYRVGKKAAGRLLDGRTHDDMPGDRRPQALTRKTAA